MLGVSHSRAFYVFPANLRGMTLALGIFQPRAGESFQLAFHGTQGQTPFEIVFRIGSAVQTNGQTLKATRRLQKQLSQLGLVGWMVVQLRLMATKSVSAWRPGRRHGNRPFGTHKRVTSGRAFIQESPKLLRACRSRILERSKSRSRLLGARR
jgi:hypothetical protein